MAETTGGIMKWPKGIAGAFIIATLADCSFNEGDIGERVLHGMDKSEAANVYGGTGEILSDVRRFGTGFAVEMWDTAYTSYREHLNQRQP